MNDLFQEMREGENYANVSMREDVWFNLKELFDQDGTAYYFHYVKQVNSSYDKDETLQELRKQKRKVNIEISKREQYLNDENN